MNNIPKYVIGIMSGTSLDGVDICYVKFEYTDSYRFDILKATTFKYEEGWKSKLKNAFTADTVSLEKLDIEYGAYLAKLINRFISENEIGKVDFIASHGHTIFHKPEEGYTLQIGNGQVMANTTQQKVVYDFRTQDVALGGQGAPLVPIGDELLFGEYAYCLNLGGFVNVSFRNNGKRIAFDICPVNIVLNHYVRKVGLEYDDKGKLAALGEVYQPLFDALNGLEYYRLPHPKSLGYEWIVEVVIPLIDSYQLKIEDILCTFTEHVAFQISKVVRQKAQLLVTGGGAFNTFLMDRIGFYLAKKIVLPSPELIDFKEALVFAFLGLLRVDNLVNCLQSVTGASKDHSSGSICEPMNNLN